MGLPRKFKLHYWPVVISAWFALTFTMSYIMAVLNGHVQPLFPYISDTGTTPPESCIFSQMINIGAAFMAIAMYIRYRQVDFAINSNDIGLRRRWNTYAFWIGNIVCLGISMVGNFQETNFLSMHLVGAFMAFGLGGVYLAIQTRITFAFRHVYYKYPQYGVGRNILYLRIFLLIIFIILFFAVLICAAIANKNNPGGDLIWWPSDRDGYHIRLVSTFSEWLLAIVFFAYTLSATNEFKSLEFEEIRFKSNCLSTNYNAQELA